MRQRLKRAMLGLQENPRPARSKKLDWPVDSFEPRRLRMGEWRIVYAVNDAERWVQVLAVRKRPPYDYGDLTELLRQLS
jgi:mRNA interferase RelE/StbE